ncbi:tRNA pseudouridine synthase 3 [Angomonas deanei]|nr:tRNA pseudouridine synthase 3 [Angomonas deanei]|eukprot:EPY26397.1 tRNA pseudouridine synthase 3 [Angomonas deanei]
MRSSTWPVGHPNYKKEEDVPPFDYCGMLNNVLPMTIRVVGFSYVEDDFDARFSCTARSYRYYFSIRHYPYNLHHEKTSTPVLLNIEHMQQAAQYFLGEQNFRNFCCMDVINVSNYYRTVYEVGIYPSEHLPEFLYYFEITANSFLYHQIRCTMEILFLVGMQLEKPEIVKTLLERGDQKPFYALADGAPLILWECHFGTHKENNNTNEKDFWKNKLDWQISRKSLYGIEKELSDLAIAFILRSGMAAGMRSQIFRWYETAPDATDESNHKNNIENENENNNHPKPVYAIGDRTRRQVFGKEDNNNHHHHVLVDGWAVLGCDWTDVRTMYSRRGGRRMDLLHMIRYEDDDYHEETDLTNNNNKQNFSPNNNNFTCYTPHNYVPLLERPVERTYTEEVDSLKGKKRARYEVNTAKKMMGDEINEGKRTKRKD